MKLLQRRLYWIEPGFQRRMILTWTVSVFLANLMTVLITIILVLHQDKTAQGTYFFLRDLLGSDPVIVQRQQIIIPVLFLSGIVGFLMTCLAGLFYSHRLAGPVYRMKKAIRDTLEGHPPEGIALRKHDEMKELAQELSLLIRRFPKSS